MKYSETISEVTHCPIPRTELLKVTKLENGQDGGGGDSDNQGGSVMPRPRQAVST